MKLASQLHQGSLVVVTHCHRPIASDIPLMLAGGVTAKVYQVSIDVDVNSGLKASRDRKDGWLRLAAIPDMSEMPRITECMVERGFSALDVQKVLGKNFLRVCEQVFV